MTIFVLRWKSDTFCCFIFLWLRYFIISQSCLLRASAFSTRHDFWLINYMFWPQDLSACSLFFKDRPRLLSSDGPKSCFVLYVHFRAGIAQSVWRKEMGTMAEESELYSRQGKGFQSPPRRPNILEGPPSLLYNEYRALFPWRWSLPLTCIYCRRQERWIYTSTPYASSWRRS